MNLIKKLFVFTVIFSTVLTLSGFSFNVASAANLSAGMLVKRPDMQAVYYLYDDAGTLKRATFPNSATYFTWFKDFSSVVTVTADELGNIPLGKNVVYRPGTRLIKITTDPKVYAIEKGGILRWIDSEATAKNLWGNNWASWIDDMPDAFYAGNYNSTNAVSNKITTTHPAGSIIKYANSNSIYYVVGNGTKRLITEAGFTANKFNEDFVIENVADTVSYTNGTDVTTSEADLFPISEGGATPISTGTLTVSGLGTPAGRSIIADSTTLVGESMVNFLDMNFTASADGNVTVTQLKLQRTGISADTDLDNLYLYAGNQRIAEGGTISSGIVTFNNPNGIFVVPAGTSKTISLKGDVNYAATAGKTIAFRLNSASDVVTGGTVSGSFPVNGNLMTVASVADLGKIAASGYTAPATADVPVNSDQTDVEVWSFTLASTNQALNVERLVLTEIGSIQVGDLTNFKLFAGGNQVATAEMAGDYTVTFDMTNAPVAITKGGSKQFSVRADVVKGSTKTFYFTFQNPTDIVAKDTNYNVYVMPYTSGTWSVIKPTGNYKISAGTVTVNRSTTSPTSNVANDSTNVVFAKFDFKASGEDVKVQNLTVKADTSVSNGGLDNGKVLVDGIQVGSTKDLTETGTPFTFGSSFVLPAGTTKVVEIVADAKTATSASLGSENVTITITTGSSNGQGVSSLQTTNVPSADKAGNPITFSSAALTMTKYSGYGNQTFVGGTTNARLGSFTLSAGASSAVNLSSITVALSSAEYGTVTNMYLKRHDTGEQYGVTKPAPSASNIFNSNLTIPASGAVVFDLYADINSNADAGTWIADIGADGTANDGATAVSATNGDIQTITIGTGSLTASNGSHPTGDILIAGSTNQEMAEFTFTARNESYTIQEMMLSIGSGMATSTAGVSLTYKNAAGNSVTSQGLFVESAGAYYASFTGLTMYVPVNDEAKVTVKTSFTSTANGADSGATGAIVLYAASGFKAVGSSGTTVTDCGDNLTANTFYLRKSKPTFAMVTQSGTPATNQPLFKFTVTSDLSVDFKQFGFQFVTSGVTVSDIKLYSSNGTALTTTGVNADADGYVKLLVGAVNDTVENIGTTAKTYYVAGTVAGWGTTGDSLDVMFKQDTTVAVDAAANTQNGSYYNVWSDRSATSHTTATADWTNGYLIKDMAGSWSFSK